jgi:hypothetical protein
MPTTHLPNIHFNVIFWNYLRAYCTCPKGLPHNNFVSLILHPRHQYYVTESVSTLKSKDSCGKVQTHSSAMYQPQASFKIFQFKIHYKKWMNTSQIKRQWPEKLKYLYFELLLLFSFFTQTKMFHVKELYQQCIPVLCNMWVEARCNIFSATKNEDQ